MHELLVRIQAALKSNIEALVERVKRVRGQSAASREDRDRFESMQSDLRSAAAEVRRSQDEERRIEASGLEEIAAVRRWSERAVLAERVGDVRLAREAHARRAECEVTVRRLAGDLTARRKVTDELARAANELARRLGAQEILDDLDGDLSDVPPSEVKVSSGKRMSASDVSKRLADIELEALKRKLGRGGGGTK